MAGWVYSANPPGFPLSTAEPSGHHHAKGIFLLVITPLSLLPAWMMLLASLITGICCSEGWHGMAALHRLTAPSPPGLSHCPPPSLSSAPCSPILTPSCRGQLWGPSVSSSSRFPRVTSRPSPWQRAAELVWVLSHAQAPGKQLRQAESERAKGKWDTC